MKKYYLLLILILSPSLAIGDSGSYGSIGMNISCGKYIKDVENDLQLKKFYSMWIAGFVTGTNLAKVRKGSTDNAANEAWLLKYCKENPLDPFHKAAIELNKALDKTKR